MGSDNSKLYAEREIPEEFKQVSSHPDIFQNILTGARLQRHVIHISSQCELQHEKDIFIFRRMHSDRLLIPHYFQNTNKDNFCGKSFQVCYFVELPAYPFSLNQRINSDKAFKLLVECLKGFELLFNKFGPFKITPKQIFFDTNNNIKVWISNNPFASKVASNTMNEHQMIQEIFDIFDILRDQRGSLFNFNSYLIRYKQKNSSHLVFRKILVYMIQEASKFFESRDTKIIKKNMRKGGKQNNPMTHTVSLKDKNRKSSEMAAFHNSNQLAFRQKVNDEMGAKVNKKTRRYNSQQSNPLKQIYPRQNQLFPLKRQEQIILVPNSRIPLRKQSVNSARNHRKSADHITFVYQQQIPPSERVCGNWQKTMNDNSTYVSQQWQRSGISKNISRKNNSTNYGFRNSSKMMTTDDDPLAKLKTIKSIVDFDGFQLDETIRMDLQKMEVNAESRIS